MTDAHLPSVNQSPALFRSDSYYCALFLPKPAKAAATCLFELARTLVGFGKKGLDLQLGLQTLGWWAEQLRPQQLAGSDHPLLAKLALALQGCGCPITPFCDQLAGLVRAAEMDLRQTRHMDAPSLAHYLDLQFGSQARALALLTGHKDPIMQAMAGQIGVAIGQAKVTAAIGRDARQGRIYIPVSELQLHGLRAHELQTAAKATSPLSPSDRVAQCATAVVTSHSRLFEHAATHAMEGATPTQLQYLKPQLIGLSLAYAQNREVQAAAHLVLQKSIVLTPARKFLLSWKMQALGRF
jgi:15-cis-phytoene synthase